MSIFAILKQRASAALDSLKADVRPIEERIEEAFHLGAVQHALHVIEADATSIEQKLLAAFHLGRGASPAA